MEKKCRVVKLTEASLGRVLQHIKGKKNVKQGTRTSCICHKSLLQKSRYLKSNPLEELMRVNNEGKNVKIYVKSGANEKIVKELLMFIEDPSSKDKQAIVLSLTGNFNLDEISALTEKMNLPGGNELKKASKK